MNWDKITLIAQTLIYTAGLTIMVIMLLLAYQSHGHIQQSLERMEKEHQAIMKMSNDTLRQMEKH